VSKPSRSKLSTTEQGADVITPPADCRMTHLHHVYYVHVTLQILWTSSRRRLRIFDSHLEARPIYLGRLLWSPAPVHRAEEPNREVRVAKTSLVRDDVRVIHDGFVGEAGISISPKYPPSFLPLRRHPLLPYPPLHHHLPRTVLLLRHRSALFLVFLLSIRVNL